NRPGGGAGEQAGAGERSGDEPSPAREHEASLKRTSPFARRWIATWPAGPDRPKPRRGPARCGPARTARGGWRAARAPRRTPRQRPPRPPAIRDSALPWRAAAHRPRHASAYSASISSAYFSAIGRRLSFIV